MLAVPNRATWETNFTKSLLNNCDVKIYDTSNNLLLDKNYISNFSLTSTNSYVCDNIPNDDCSITVLNWNLLSLEVQRYLTHKKVVRIKYTVNGIETTDYKVLLIKETKVSRDNTQATILLHSPINNATLYEGIIVNFSGSSQAGNPLCFVSLPNDVTNATAYQHACLFNCKGVKYVDDDKASTGVYPYMVLKDYDPYTPDGNFNALNIYGDYDINKETQDKSNITIYGVNFASEEEFQLGGKMDSSTTNHLLFESSIYDYNKMPYKITRFTAIAQTTPTQDRTSKFYLMKYLKKVDVMRVGTRTQQFIYVTVYASKATLADVANEDEPYIQTYALEEGSQELIDAQDYCRNYFSNDTFLECDCRIDPTLEPLDIVYMPIGSSGYFRVALESVTINFNGGFSGHIIGRLINPYTIMSLSNYVTSFTVGDTYVFGGTAEVSTSYGTQLDVTEDCTYSGYTMSTIGTQTITVTYKNISSTYTITVRPKAPTVSNIIIAEDNTIKFTVKNPNGQTATLHIVSTQGEVTRTFSSNETFTFNSSIFIGLDDIIGDSVLQYQIGHLEDDVYCYFTANSVNSNSTTILEANY